jgi:hypothetical protein
MHCRKNFRRGTASALVFQSRFILLAPQSGKRLPRLASPTLSYSTLWIDGFLRQVQHQQKAHSLGHGPLANTALYVFAL